MEVRVASMCTLMSCVCGIPTCCRAVLDPSTPREAARNAQQDPPGIAGMLFSFADLRFPPDIYVFSFSVFFAEQLQS